MTDLVLVNERWLIEMLTKKKDPSGEYQYIFNKIAHTCTHNYLETASDSIEEFNN